MTSNGGTGDHALFLFHNLSKDIGSSIHCEKNVKTKIIVKKRSHVIHQKLFCSLCWPIDEAIIMPVYEFHLKTKQKNNFQIMPHVAFGTALMKGVFFPISSG